ncbi:putative response regulator receiver protein [Colletotrichum sublineola]|uniref:Putative response regulator receiver protein n=1 Tax=Colletotrichum sublineola TaxID=1173701 RepID=A0A066XB12_COLSU|nr:putative response regulator receiver protein [Colletotrichum sublineola]
MTETESLPVKVLIADHNHVNIRILTKYLTRLGLHSETVNNGKEVLEAYQNDPQSYQCILIKPALPVMSGTESTRLIREFEREGNLNPCSIVWLVPSMSPSPPDLVRQYAVTATMKWPMKLTSFTQVLDEVGIPTTLPETTTDGV